MIHVVNYVRWAIIGPPRRAVNPLADGSLHSCASMRPPPLEVAAAPATRALVRRALLQAGPLARAALAERTGLSRAAVTNICQDLLELGHVRETGDRIDGRSPLGRKRMPLELCPTGGYAVGVLVAADNSAVAILDLRGRLVDQVRLEPPAGGPAAVLGYLARVAATRVAALRIPLDRLVGVGVSVTGTVNPHTGVLRLSPLLGWADVPIAPPFEAELGPRVTVDNPLRAIATAEMLFGSAASSSLADFILVNVSTAVGAALVLGGRIYRGSDYASGQIGHVTVRPDGPPCPCGRRGCLDVLASGEALLALARARGARFPSFGALVAAAAAGDALAGELVDESARIVGDVVADLITTLNPALVAISGMVLAAGPRYVDVVRQVALSRAYRATGFAPRVVASAFGTDAGILGAGALALEAQLYDVRRWAG